MTATTLWYLIALCANPDGICPSVARVTPLPARTTASDCSTLVDLANLRDTTMLYFCTRFKD